MITDRTSGFEVFCRFTIALLMTVSIAVGSFVAGYFCNLQLPPGRDVVLTYSEMPFLIGFAASTIIGTLSTIGTVIILVFIIVNLVGDKS